MDFEGPFEMNAGHRSTCWAPSIIHSWKVSSREQVVVYINHFNISPVIISVCVEKNVVNMLMSLNGYRDQAVLRHRYDFFIRLMLIKWIISEFRLYLFIIRRKRSVIFQWLTAIFLFVNLVACLTLISAICNQNELLKATRSNEEGVYFTPNINTVCKSMCNLR